MIIKGSFSSAETQQYEADFAFSWLSKFAQAILAILPGILIGVLTPFLIYSPFTFIFLLLISLLIAWLINELIGKKLSKEKESLVPRCAAYALCYIALNILHQNGVNILIANLTLTFVIVMQAVYTRSF